MRSNNDSTTIILPSSTSSLQWVIVGGLIIVTLVWLQYILAKQSTSTSTTSNIIHSSSLSSHRETKRRIQHAVTGTVLVILSYFIPPNLGMWLLFLGAVGIIHVKSCHERWYHQAFGPLLRPSELQQQALPGAFYFLMGVASTMWLVPLPYARYATLCLSWADPMASWAGQYFAATFVAASLAAISSTTGNTTTTNTGSSWWKLHTLAWSRILSFQFLANASVAGCMACFVTAFFIGYFGSKPLGLPSTATTTATTTTTTLSISVVLRYGWSALVCTLAEACPVGNDNLLIPIATALALYLYDQQYQQ